MLISAVAGQLLPPPLCLFACFLQNTQKCGTKALQPKNFFLKKFILKIHELVKNKISRKERRGKLIF